MAAVVLAFATAPPLASQCPPPDPKGECESRTLGQQPEDVFVLATVLSYIVERLQHEGIRGYCIKLGGATPEPALLRAIAGRLTDLGQPRAATLLHPYPDCADQSRVEPSLSWPDWPILDLSLTARSCPDGLIIDADHATGTVGGEGRTYTLARQGDQWEIRSSCERWIS